ncbi:MAG: ChbG/HpnK family deacetylase [Acidimicrobiales bacterium]
MATNRAKVVINGDDLGMSDEVNRETLRWAHDGILTSATTLATAPAFSTAPASELVAMGVSVGVHLDFSEFAPLTTNPALAPMLDADGNFKPVLRSMKPTKAFLAAVTDEAIAQVERMSELGVTPDHLDSHHHDHFNTWMTLVLRRVRKQTGVARIRCPYTGPEIGGAKAQFARKRGRDLQRLAGFKTPQHFMSLDYVGDHGAETLRGLVGVVELMTHPGGHSLGATEETTARALRDADFVELVNYTAVDGA